MCIENTATTSHGQLDTALCSHKFFFFYLSLAFLSFGCTLKWYKTEDKEGPECLGA